MSFKQEKAFITGLESFEFNSQDLDAQQQQLESRQVELEEFLASNELKASGLKKQHPLPGKVEQFNTLKQQYIPAWEQAKKDLAPALELADSFADKLMFLVFGKFNAGKSSFCNLIADRFKFHQKEVQPFILENGQLQFHDEAFKEGSTETTAHIQGVILDERLVLIDTPGLHSITSENAELTQQFLESADGILWLSSSTSPGQVQELQELAQELRRRKPLLPVITRSDFLDEVFVDNDIKKMLCNKTPDNRAIQEEDVLQRAQDKLNSLGMEPGLVQPPTSISVYSAREHGLTDEALSEAGLYRLYQAILDLAKPVVSYKERKPLEVFIHYLEEVVLSDVDNLIEQLKELQSLCQSNKEQLNLDIAAIKNTVWQNALSSLPTFMDKYLTSVSENPTQHFVRDFTERVKELLKTAINKQLALYEVDLQAVLNKTDLSINILLSMESYEKFYLEIEKILQHQLNDYADVITEQCESHLDKVEAQLEYLLDNLEQRQSALLILDEGKAELDLSEAI
jgi:GTPase SAR1 family protein